MLASVFVLLLATSFFADLAVSLPRGRGDLRKLRSSGPPQESKHATGGNYRNLLSAKCAARQEKIGDVLSTSFKNETSWLPVSFHQQFDIADTKHRYLCMAESMVPDLFVLGVQKSGNTSLPANLKAAGVISECAGCQKLPFFDPDVDFVKSFNKVRHTFMNSMPKCPKSGEMLRKRTVLADITPDSFGLVPRPRGFSSKSSIFHTNAEDINMPWRLHEMYGEGLSRKMEFIVGIREPLAHMQSVWYKAAESNFTKECPSCAAPTFEDALQSALDGLNKDPPEISEWVWDTMYGSQLEEWLQRFSPAQFSIIPMHQFSYSSEARESTCYDLIGKLEFVMQCGGGGGGG